MPVIVQPRTRSVHRSSILDFPLRFERIEGCPAAAAPLNRHARLVGLGADLLLAHGHRGPSLVV
jgi:hypothetical protein